MDPRGIALDFCEATAPNGERGASQKSSVTVLKRSTGAFSHWVQFPSLREQQKEKEETDGILFFFLVDPRGIRTRVCADARYRSFTYPAQTMHIAVRGTAYAGVQLV